MPEFVLLFEIEHLKLLFRVFIAYLLHLVHY